MKFLSKIHSFTKHPSFSFILNGIEFLGVFSYAIWITFYLYTCTGNHCYNYLKNIIALAQVSYRHRNPDSLAFGILIAIPISLGVAIWQFKIAFGLWKSLVLDNSKEDL